MTKPTTAATDLETVAQLAERADVDPETVRKAIRAGQLAAQQIGRDYLIERAAGDAFVARQAERRKAERVRVESQIQKLQRRARSLKRRTSSK